MPRPFWLDRPERPDPLPALSGVDHADLLVVGGGYSGLWAALIAKQRMPGRDVVLVEAGTCGWAASGRNGGFCAASLTHGLSNGVERFPDEIGVLEALGRANLDAIGSTVDKYDIDCDFERSGELEVAVEPYQLDGPGRVGRAGPGPRPRRHAARPRRGARGGRLADLPRRAVGQGPGRHARPGPARLGPAPRLRRARRADLRAHPGDRPGPRRRRHARPHAGRFGAGRPGRPGHQRLPAAVAPAAVLPGAGLRLRADDPRPHARRARLDRLAQPAGDRRHRQPVPLLPDHAGRPDPLRRVRRDLPLRQPDGAGARAARRDVRGTRRALLRHVPAVGGRALHASLGRRHRHVRAVLRVLRNGVRRPAGVRRRLHRARRRRLPLRRPGDARPPRRRIPPR